MAGGIGAILTLLGKVDAGNALVVTGDSSGSGDGVAPPSTLGDLQGKVDSSNRLVVKFV